MNKRVKTLSVSRINRLKVQGYSGYSDTELTAFAFGNRFAYWVCLIILLLGVITANAPMLFVISVVAFGGIFLPYHPFDYIYNHLIRHKLNRPALPPRSKQLKFTCTIATFWMITTALLFHFELYFAGYVMGSLLAIVAFIVSTTDVCIPSIIYNFLFKVKL